MVDFRGSATSAADETSAALAKHCIDSSQFSMRLDQTIQSAQTDRWVQAGSARRLAVLAERSIVPTVISWQKNNNSKGV